MPQANFHAKPQLMMNGLAIQLGLRMNMIVDLVKESHLPGEAISHGVALQGTQASIDASERGRRNTQTQKTKNSK